MKVEDLPGHRSHLRISLSDNFVSPLTQVNNRLESNEITARIVRLKEQSNPKTRAETSKKISVDQEIHIARKWSQIHHTMLEPP